MTLGDLRDKAKSVSILYKNPNNKRGEWPAKFGEKEIEFNCGNFDILGEWILQVKVVLNDGSIILPRSYKIQKSSKSRRNK